MSVWLIDLKDGFCWQVILANLHYFQRHLRNISCLLDPIDLGGAPQTSPPVGGGPPPHRCRCLWHLAPSLKTD